MAWLERYYSERMREVLIQQRDEAKLQIEAADTTYRTGKGAQADVFAARSAVAQIEDRIAQADRQVLAAQGNAVSQDCRGILDEVNRAVRTLQQNAADRARQKRSAARTKGKFT